MSDPIPCVITGRQWRLIAPSPEYMAAFPRLTELTLIYPHPYDITVTETGILLDMVEIVRSTTLKLVNTCRSLPDFETLQIVHFLLGEPLPIRGPGTTGYGSVPCSDYRKQELRERVKGVRDLAIDSLKAKAGCREGEGRKVMLRVIELNPHLSLVGDHLGSAEVEEVEE